MQPPWGQRGPRGPDRGCALFCPVICPAARPCCFSFLLSLFCCARMRLAQACAPSRWLPHSACPSRNWPWPCKYTGSRKGCSSTRWLTSTTSSPWAISSGISGAPSLPAAAGATCRYTAGDKKSLSSELLNKALPNKVPSDKMHQNYPSETTFTIVFYVENQ